MKDSLSLATINYRQKWNEEILTRRDELLRRFPDFAPSFVLQQVGEALEYSFHMEPVTKRGRKIAETLPNLFPRFMQLQPIEMLWRDESRSEIAVFLDMFLSQVWQEEKLPDKTNEEIEEKRRQQKEARLTLARIGIATILVMLLGTLNDYSKNSKTASVCPKNNPTLRIGR